jgi:isopenicillin N synthase-like dioxygenase
MQSIPVVDLRDFTSGSPETRARFVETVGQALTDLGFFALENHGVDAGLIDKAYSQCRAFFALPEATKKKYEDLRIGGQRGFTSFGREHAKDSKAPDLKEFWHVGREAKPGENLGPEFPANIWPTELPEFKKVMHGLYEQLDLCSDRLLEACAVYLGEPVRLFADAAKGGNSILRVINYPEVPANRDPASIRAAAHEDINLITLLCEATAPGLELLQRDGKWRKIEAKPGQIVVDTGDMIQNWTNGILRSTTHRVVNPDNDRQQRFSMPFFVHPRSEIRLDPLASCIKKSGGKKLWPDITAGDYLAQRLREIGLTK